MKRYLRQLAGLAGVALLLLIQLGSTAHAGISSATIRINLSVVNSPVPTSAPTLTGNFTYGIVCVPPSGPVMVWAPATPTIAVNGPTPLTAFAAAVTSTGAFPSVCTVTQLTRPAPPLGYVWNGAPAAVVHNNVQTSDQQPPTYQTDFNNVLSPATFAVTAIATVGGTVNCASPVTYGNTSSCTATASPGYAFVGFSTSGCGAPSSNTSFTTAAITANCNVTAQFAATRVQEVPTLNGWSLLLLVALTLGVGGLIRRRQAR